MRYPFEIRWKNTFLTALAGTLISCPLRAEVVEEPPAETSTRSTASTYESPLNWGFNLQFSLRKYPNYQFAPGIISTSEGKALQFSFEWMPITNYGKLGIGIGTGAYLLQDVDLGGGVSSTLYTFPIETYIAYRFDYFHNQIIVPFARVGPSVTLVKQGSRTGGDRSGLQRYMGLEYALGGELLLNFFEPSAARSLDLSTGINYSYLTFEYLVSSAMGSSGGQPDLSRKEYRASLRFEF